MGMHCENKVVIGHITGIPIVMDPTLIVLILLYGGSYFSAGSAVLVAQGAFIVAGGIGSILLHELAHAWAGRLVRCEATHIELNGMGGLCTFGRAPATTTDDIFVTLAGPAANLALWALFYWLGHGLMWLTFDVVYDGDGEQLRELPLAQLIVSSQAVFATLASLNISLFVFNLMPSFPLDGGTALAGILSKRYGHAEAVKTVAALGYVVCALCVYEGLQGHFFMLVVAYSLFAANEERARIFGRSTWTRWN